MASFHLISYIHWGIQTVWMLKQICFYKELYSNCFLNIGLRCNLYSWPLIWGQKENTESWQYGWNSNMDVIVVNLVFFFSIDFCFQLNFISLVICIMCICFKKATSIQVMLSCNRSCTQGNSCAWFSFLGEWGWALTVSACSRIWWGTPARLLGRLPWVQGRDSMFCMFGKWKQPVFQSTRIASRSLLHLPQMRRKGCASACGRISPLNPHVKTFL